MNNSIEMNSQEAFRHAAEDYKNFPVMKDVVAKIESFLSECAEEGIIDYYKKEDEDPSQKIRVPMYVAFGFMRGLYEPQQISLIKVHPHTDLKNFTLSYDDSKFLNNRAYIALTESGSHYYTIVSDDLNNEGAESFFGAVRLSLKAANLLFGHGGFTPPPPPPQFRH